MSDTSAVLIDKLADSPLLLLFSVAAIGFFAGRVRFFGTRIGAGAVLFVGLAVGAVDPRLRLPEVVLSLGLALFVYTVGLSGGPAFATMIRRRSWRPALIALGVVGVCAGLVAAVAVVAKIPADLAAGVFSGALTNTPALAAVLEVGQQLGADGGANVSQAVVGYSLTYPLGILAVIVVGEVLRRIWRLDYAEEAAVEEKRVWPSLVGKTLRVTNQAATLASLHDVLKSAGLSVVVGRKLSNGRLTSAGADEPLLLGDLITVVGGATEVERTTVFIGEASDVELTTDRRLFDYRRILVSNPRVAGRSLAELALPKRFGAVVTRLRRGDVELLPSGRTVLELGDRIRVVAARDSLVAVASFLGDSDRKISEIDVVSLGLGIAAGLLLGQLSIPIAGGLRLQLGTAGGPLVAALVLGALHRTGPVVWSLPHGANLTLRQLGLVLFLAAVGTRAGTPFLETLRQGGPALFLVALGAATTVLAALLTMWLGRRYLGISASQALGLVAGIQTQPALLAYAQEESKSELPALSYSTVFPLAFVAKVITAQILFLLLA